MGPFLRAEPVLCRIDQSIDDLYDTMVFTMEVTESCRSEVEGLA